MQGDGEGMVMERKREAREGEQHERFGKDCRRTERKEEKER